MTRFISTPSRTKEILAKYDLRAKKGFGQNFLVDPKIVERCAEEAHCEGAVIEIGPGIGSLTEQLALHSKHVTAYEVDEDLIPVLAEKETYGTVSVCANLPYYITSPVLFRLFEEAPDIPYITVMVQKEVGERFAAKVNDKEYSALSPQF